MAVAAAGETDSRALKLDLILSEHRKNIQQMGFANLREYWFQLELLCSKAEENSSLSEITG
jgi:hypothetical protein